MKKIRKIPKRISDSIADFIAQFAALEADRVALCQYLVRLIDEDKYTKHYIHQECPKLSMAKLNLMERVGRGDFHPALLDAITPGEVMLSKMSYAEQCAAIDRGEKIPVATIDDDGKRDVVLLSPLTLTHDQKEQVSRVVGGQRVYIGMDEQYAWLVDHRTNLATRQSNKEDPKWVVVNQTIVTTKKNTVLTLADLAEAMHALTHCATCNDDTPPDDKPNAPGSKVPKKPIRPTTPAGKRKTLKELAAIPQK